MATTFQDLASDYLSGLLTDQEAAAFEQRLQTASAEERAAFAALQDATALLLLSETPALEAPAALRSAVLNAAAEIPAGSAKEPPVFTYSSNEEGWSDLPMPVPGARWKPLYVLPGGPQTFLMELPAGCEFPDHPHHGVEECLLISGDLINDGVRLGPGDYVRARAGTHHHGLRTEGGCVCLIILRAA